jgi:uroporphyrinogen-III synthase
MSARVLVVRSGENALPFAPEMEGLEIVEKLSHQIVPLDPPLDAFDEAADLAVFTSQIAVRRVTEEPALRGRFAVAIRRGQIAAVGPATAEALAEAGFPPAIVAQGSAENVLEQIPGRLEGLRVLLPRGEDASEELREGLIHRGARVAPVVLYRKVPRPADLEIGREIVERPFAAFCATSPAAARWLLEGLPAAALARLKKTPAVVLGRFTARFLDSHGVERIEISPEATFGAAAELLAALARGERGRGTAYDDTASPVTRTYPKPSS